jgi:hypothetical protein
VTAATGGTRMSGMPGTFINNVQFGRMQIVGVLR